jgi:tetratricopeptide (TPR) repeat protein
MPGKFRTPFPVLPALLAVLLPLLFAGSAAPAGMAGQPRPPAEAARKIAAAVRDIVGAGDLGTARPDLYLTVEANATSDLTDLLAPVVGDDTTYNGLVGTFEDAARGKTGAQADYVAYNLARLHLFRARAGSRPALAEAARAAAPLQKSRDMAALDLLGDIYATQNNTDQAIATYARMITSGTPGAAPYAHLKTAALYQRMGRLADAEAAYTRGIRADAASGSPRGEMLHRLYQGLAGLYLERNNLPAALDALARSARVTQDREAPYRLRLDVAQRLLRSGNPRAVADYADAAVRFAPDDEDARALRDRARALAGRATGK